MKRFWKKAGRGYMETVEPFNAFWSYLFSREWCNSAECTLYMVVLMAVLIPVTPFAYLCVAPVVAVIEGMREEGE